MAGQQRFHLPPQFIIPGAHLIDVCGSFLGGPFECAMEDRLHSDPAFFSHGEAFTRWVFSQARAKRQSRMTVLGATPRTSAVSSTSRPAKKRSSTTCILRRSK